MYSLFDAYMYLPVVLTENTYFDQGNKMNVSTNVKFLKCQKVQSGKVMSTALSALCVLRSWPHCEGKCKKNWGWIQLVLYTPVRKSVLLGVTYISLLNMSQCFFIFKMYIFSV